MGKHLTQFQEGFLKGLLTARTHWHKIKDVYENGYGRPLSSSVLDRVNKLSVCSKTIKRETRGRKRKTSKRDDRMIKQTIKKNRMKSWEEIAEALQESYQIDVMRDSVKSRTEEVGIRNYKALKKPKLTPKKVKNGCSSQKAKRNGVSAGGRRLCLLMRRN